MPAAYRTITGEAVAEIEAKRSVFRATLARAGSEEQARALIERVRSAHRDARHHCTAMVIGPQGRLQRTNDDGEPAGTAGSPMLEVLRGEDLSDVVAVVTRWFGGTLLGTGGLVRAYSDAVRAAVAGAQVVRREPVEIYQLALPHAVAGRVEHELRSRGLDLRVDYGEQAVLRFGVGVEEADGVAALVAQVTGGGVLGDPVDCGWTDHPV
ncbi:IMPACT family protein [Ruania zhangjianzhongii]|uniref:IMPACT family protein n=1 Tax=Ruania zhangjianzhongii TaxID=2603206 RepID=UPI0011CA3A97|nr:YigZ family protein [Ruania zhangjianzhongii]